MKKLATTVCSKMNVYASSSKSNCNPISYKGNLTEGLNKKEAMKMVKLATCALGRIEKKYSYVVARSLLLLLFNGSAWPYLGLA